MQKSINYIILVTITLGIFGVLVLTLPELGLAELIAVGIALIVITFVSHFLYSRELNIITQALNEKTIAYDKSRNEVYRLKSDFEHATTKDELTGIYNAAHFMVLLNHERALTERADYNFSLGILEIDQYFEIIRTFGTAQANEVLKLAARVIVAAMREVDHVARIKDGKFLMSLSGATEENSALVLQRVSDLVCQIKIEAEGAENFKITTSCGLTSYHGTESTEQLIANADKALEYAIAQGRDKVAGYLFDKDKEAKA